MDKLIFFDFNGTLTKNKNCFDFIINNNSKVNKIKKLIYKLWGKFYFIRKAGINSVINRLKKDGCTKQYIEENSKKISLKPEAISLFKTLQKIGYKIFIISGGFKCVIENALGDNLALIERIYSNDIIFENNLIKGATTVKCDFKGKAEIIENECAINNSNLQNAIYVGNEFNDINAFNLNCKKFLIGDNQKLQKLNAIKIESLADILNFV